MAGFDYPFAPTPGGVLFGSCTVVGRIDFRVSDSVIFVGGFFSYNGFVVEHNGRKSGLGDSVEIIFIY